ncbi:MAG: Asp-tRNA(Asn)/Glu-tRNA(Gln) amidotransferase GatCAB subunit A [Halomonas sp.]|jgi:aspartyl-tRNA(Asn)/glutamyl-tRNA(Gln) amidotransferase subunit A|nr:MAG: Asp-tRNA(Asn)/Glu-tRNA(Gln) amidotransferase GatCAB subunit A [Halomonas sp.]|tara:strand:+ start:8785 stop:10245 length:1461 start_codon:yes stop_codon:yes gene_type:complete
MYQVNNVTAIGSEMTTLHQQLHWMTLTEVANSIRQRDISVSEIIESSLQRIEQVRPEINAFIEVFADEAREAATEADRRLQCGSPVGPLFGVPIGYKDMFSQLGKRASGASRIMGDVKPLATATVLRRLKDAGAINIAALNMSEFAAGPTGHNDHFGHCRNAWHQDHVSGGSSSGSGAATAAGAVYAAIGSDTGGSVRLPAAFNGLVGLKPTWGRISRHATMPRSWTLDTVGPLTRTTADCALMTSVIAGYDTLDSTTSQLSVPDYMSCLDASVRGLRVGVPANYFRDDISDEINELFEDACQVLIEQGCQVKIIEVPDPGEYDAIANAISKTEAASIHSKWMREQPQNYGLHAYSRTEFGFHVPATMYVDALSVRGAVMRDFVSKVFSKVDVMLTPVLNFEVPTIDETDERNPERISSMVGRITRNTRPFNYLGLPALTVPCGFTANHLPVGLQIVGRPFAETQLFTLASAYEKSTPWKDFHPSL